ncbi:MAG: hypothetical protein D6714_19240 [Bacteroidetes bacterium]|nr:MAG: hypothetical protein D6714_19240 [Bacteroidota bacterium]
MVRRSARFFFIRTKESPETNPPRCLRSRKPEWRPAHIFTLKNKVPRAPKVTFPDLMVFVCLRVVRVAGGAS